jgi:acetyl-CoA acetyltransferase
MSNYIRLDRCIERGIYRVEARDNAKLNVNGGAIAIGHPLGCSGARLATTLIHQMARTGAARGIASLCVGVGQGLATVFERE